MRTARADARTQHAPLMQAPQLEISLGKVLETVIVLLSSLVFLLQETPDSGHPFNGSFELQVVFGLNIFVHHYAT